MMTSLPNRSPNQLLPCRSIWRATRAWTWVTLGKYPTRRVSFAPADGPARMALRATAIAAKVRARAAGAPARADCLVIVATSSLFELRTVVVVDRISDAVVDGFRCYQTGTASIYGDLFKCICRNMSTSMTPRSDQWTSHTIMHWQVTSHNNALAGRWLRSILTREGCAGARSHNHMSNPGASTSLRGRGHGS